MSGSCCVRVSVETRQSFYFKSRLRQTVRNLGNDESLALTRAVLCSQSLRVPAGAVQHGSLGAAASAWRRQERGSVSDGEAGARGCRLPRGRGSQRSSACRPQTHGIPVLPRCYSTIFPGSRLCLPLPRSLPGSLPGPARARSRRTYLSVLPFRPHGRFPRAPPRPRSPSSPRLLSHGLPAWRPAPARPERRKRAAAAEAHGRRSPPRCRLRVRSRRPDPP